MNYPAMPKLLLVISAVYPHLVDFIGQLNFRYKSCFTPLKALKTKLLRGFPEFSNQNLRQIGPGVYELWSDKQIIKQTYKQRLLLYIHKY